MDEISSPVVWMAGLHSSPPKRASWLSWPGPATSGTVSITDGPYTETAEYLGGITVIDVPDLETAKMWAGRVAEGCGWPQEVRVIK